MYKVSFAENCDIKGINEALEKSGAGFSVSEYGLCMKAVEDGELRGISAFSVHSCENGTFFAVLDYIVMFGNDEEIEFSLGSGTLNALERRGIFDVYCSNAEMLPLLKRLRFKEVGTLDVSSEVRGFLGECKLYYVNLEGYFVEPCKQ